MSNKSVNKVIVIGNCGGDPDVRYTASGKPVAKVSLAVNERYKDGHGEWQERTEWVSIVAWQRLAEIVGEFVHKGSRLYVEGRLRTESWEDRQSGERRYKTTVVAGDLVLLSNGRGEPTDENKRQEPPQREPAEATTTPIDDSEIPF